MNLIWNWINLTADKMYDARLRIKRKSDFEETGEIAAEMKSE